jgi:hypothetical protein
MDTPQWQSTALANRLLQELRHVTEHLASLRNELKQYTEAIHATKERQKHTDNPPITVRFPDDVTRQTQAENDRQYSVQDSIRWATWLAFAAATIYGSIAYLQWREMIEATDAATRATNIARVSSGIARQAIQLSKEQFQRDQRPYIWNSRIEPLPSSTSTQKLYINIHLANYGKSPAIQQVGKGKIFFGKDALAQADQWFVKLGDKRLPIADSVGIIPPGIPTNPTDTNSRTTIFTDRMPTEPEMEYIGKHDATLVGVYRTEYSDAAGNPYRTDMCFYRAVNTAIVMCEKHNEIK